MAAIIELTNDEWDLVKDLFDPAGRPGVPTRYPRRLMFEAMLFLARTGLSSGVTCRNHHPAWEAV